MVPGVDAAGEAGKLLEHLPTLWDEATLAATSVHHADIVTGMNAGSLHDAHAHPALGPLHVIVDMLIGHQPVFGEVGPLGRVYNAVSHRHITYLDRAK